MDINKISNMLKNINQTPVKTEQTKTIELYPECNSTNKQSSDKAPNLNDLSSLMNVLSLLKNKDNLNINSLLSSPIGKNLGIDPNALALINLLSTNKKTSIMKSNSKSTLPKIDSLERIKTE